MRPIDADKLIEQMEAETKEMTDPLCRMMFHAAIHDVKEQPIVLPEQGKYKEGYIDGANWAVREIARKIGESLDDEFSKYMNPPTEE